MHVLFLMLSAQGHVNPSLAITRALVGQGARVTHVLPPSFERAVTDAGATFRLLPDSLDIGGHLLGAGQVDLGRMLPSLLKFMGSRQRSVRALAPVIAADPPDLIVYDSMCAWGGALASHSGVRAATLSTTFALRPGTPTVQRIASSLPMFVPKSMLKVLMSEEALNLVTVPRAFQPDAAAFDARYAFVGPCLAPRGDAGDFPLEQLQDGLLYISLGTTPLNDNPAFFRACFEAFGNQERQVVLSSGRAELSDAPENFIVRPFVPQLEVLERAGLFITHGGMNSMMEALSLGVPLVAVPQGLDQHVTAERMVELGLGVALEPTEVTAATLRAAVDRVSSDAQRPTHLSAMQHAIHTAGGASQAAEVLTRYAGREVVDGGRS